MLATYLHIPQELTSLSNFHVGSLSIAINHKSCEINMLDSEGEVGRRFTSNDTDLIAELAKALNLPANTTDCVVSVSAGNLVEMFLTTNVENDPFQEACKLLVATQWEVEDF